MTKKERTEAADYCAQRAAYWQEAQQHGDWFLAWFSMKDACGPTPSAAMRAYDETSDDRGDAWTGDFAENH